MVLTNSNPGSDRDREYTLPEGLARHLSREAFAPDELRGVCREAGVALGLSDAAEARFRSAAQMVALWEGLDLPAWVAPYALRDARLGYLKGYTEALLSGDLSVEQTSRAAEARWGGAWKEKLAAARGRAEG